MNRILIVALLGLAALLPGRALAQEKPALNTAPPGTPPQPQPNAAPTQPAPVPTRADSTFRRPYSGPPGAPPAPNAPLPTPDYNNPNSPSGLELPGREQARKAAQQYAEQNTKFFIYSGLGLGYSSFNGVGLFNVSVSPALGYRLTDRIAVGPGFSYAYANYSVGNGLPNISTNSIGYKAFAQIIVYKQFFIHGEYEITNAQFPDDGTGRIIYNPSTGQYIKSTQQVQSPLAGVGYRSQISNRAAADIVVLYNFNDTFSNRLYTNPVVRFNFLINIGR